MLSMKHVFWHEWRGSKESQSEEDCAERGKIKVEVVVLLWQVCTGTHACELQIGESNMM